MPRSLRRVAERAVSSAPERPPQPAARPGRPPKYGRRARPVSVTLPEDLIQRLQVQHFDLGRAIVELFEARPASDTPVQLAEFGRGALILVPPASALKRLPG